MVIFAPTACGKTALTERLFGHGSFSILNTQAEIISADSVAVYKELSIGSAKPDSNLRQRLPHHLIDIISYTQQFSVADFVERADKACTEIWNRKNVPVIVGGTGFYIRNFLLGLPVAPEANATVRSTLQARLHTEGIAALYAELCTVDATSAAKIHPHDAYRICRALEVWYTAGKALSSFALPCTLRNKYAFCTIILTRQREELYTRICTRVEHMFATGLEAEVASLLQHGATAAAPGMHAIGYREFFLPELQHLSATEKTTYLKAAIIHNTKKYAKKQITFMRDIPHAQHFHAEAQSDIAAYMHSWAQAHVVHA